MQGTSETLEDKIDNQEYRNRLSEILSDASKDTSEKIQSVLQLGAEWFGVENGHLVRIDPAHGTHTIIELSEPHPAIAKGDVSDLSTTYCRKVIAQGNGLAVHNAPKQGWSGDPAYEAYKLSTYLGAKVLVDEELYGTVCFVDEDPRVEPFTESDAAALALIVRTMGQILERRRHEDRLRQTSARLEALFEDSPDMINIHDTEGHLILPNPRLCENTGFEPEELIRMKVWDLDCGISSDEAEALWTEMGPGDRHRREGEYRCKDGSTFPVEVDLRCLDLEGKDRFVATARDITERKERERALRREKDRFESLVQEVDEYAIFMLDTEGYIRSWNAGAERIKGYSEEDIIGEPLSTFYTEEDREAEIPEKNLQRAAAEGSVQDEGWRVRKDGSRFWADVTLTALHKEDGSLRGFAKVTRDLTERRRRERRYEAIFNQTFQFTGLMEPDGTLIEVNDTALEFGNLEKEDVLGMPLWETYWAQTGEASKQRLKDAIERAAQGEFVRYERQIRGAEETRSVDFSIRPITDEEGEVSLLLPEARDITERRKRENELEEAREQVELALEHTDSIIFGIDLESGSVWRRGPFEDFFGVEAEEVSTMETFTERAVHPEDREQFRRFYQSLVEGERNSGEFEYRTNPEIGASRWIRDHVYAEEKRGSRQLLGLAQDVTQRKERREELRRQKNLLEQTQRLAGAWEVDLRSGALSWSDQVYRIHEIEPEVEITVEQAIEFFRPEARPKIREAFERCAEEGEPYDLELPIVTAEGNRRWVRTVGAPAETEDGEVVKVAGAFQDVTERREAQEALKESEERFRGVFESAAIGIAIVGDEGQLIEANPVLQDMTGYGYEELQHCHFAELTHPDDIEKDQALFEELMEGTRDRYQIEKRYVRSDGEVFWGRLTVSRHGEERVIGMVEDIDEQKRQKKELRAAKEEAERLNRMKSAFLANMSHEIRTPLTSIIGFAETIGEEVEAAPVEEMSLSTVTQFAKLIEESGHRLLETLDAVLNLSQLEAGEMNLSPDPTNLTEEAEKAAELFEPRAAETGIELHVETPSDPIWGRADEGGLRIALQNLLSNALKYTEPGGSVWIRTRMDEGNAVVEVEDTGIGMDPARVPELFEPFRQASEGVGREYEGTGLGLAVTKKAVERMGGSIDVETEEGTGSCFTLQFPKADPSEA